MRKSARSFLLVVLTLVSAVVLGVSSTLTSAAVSVAANTALIMGGTGRPDPDNFPLYKENVQTYYINTQSVCAETGANCAPLSVTTPETAWPLYGGLSAPTWRDSILQGVGDLDAVVQGILPTLLT